MLNRFDSTPTHKDHSHPGVGVWYLYDYLFIRFKNFFIVAKFSTLILFFKILYQNIQSWYFLKKIVSKFSSPIFFRKYCIQKFSNYKNDYLVSILYTNFRGRYFFENIVSEFSRLVLFLKILYLNLEGWSLSENIVSTFLVHFLYSFRVSCCPPFSEAELRAIFSHRQ